MSDTQAALITLALFLSAFVFIGVGMVIWKVSNERIAARFASRPAAWRGEVRVVAGMRMSDFRNPRVGDFPMHDTVLVAADRAGNTVAKRFTQYTAEQVARWAVPRTVDLWTFRGHLVARDDRGEVIVSDRHHGTVYDVMTCPFCDERFTEAEALADHVRHVHVLHDRPLDPETRRQRRWARVMLVVVPLMMVGAILYGAYHDDGGSAGSQVVHGSTTPTTRGVPSCGGLLASDVTSAFGAPYTLDSSGSFGDVCQFVDGASDEVLVAARPELQSDFDANRSIALRNGASPVTGLDTTAYSHLDGDDWSITAHAGAFTFEVSTKGPADTTDRLAPLVRVVAQRLRAGG